MTEPISFRTHCPDCGAKETYVKGQGMIIPHQQDCPRWDRVGRALLAKHSRANYPPKSGCKFCHGTGERPDGRPCICIFVDHSFSDEAAKAIGEAAKKALKDMRG